MTMRAVAINPHLARRRNQGTQPYNCDSDTSFCGALETRNRGGRCMEVVSKQSTKVTCISTKLEWRIEQFEKLMHLYKNGSHLVSKQFYCPQVPNVVWELHVYPNGKREEDINNVSFFLRQVGLQRGEDPIMTEFQIFTVDTQNARISVCRDTKDFSNQQGRGKFQVAREKMMNALRPDGSLMVICEVEYLPPGAKQSVEHTDIDTCYEDPAANAETVVAKTLRDMWQSELFADCSLKVGNKQISAHRCVIAQHSDVFRSMFEQKCTLEAQCGVVDITDARPETVQGMVQYMYTGEVAPHLLQEMEDVLDLLAVADKYAVIPLKEYCERNLIPSMNAKRVPYMVLYADTYSANILKKACIRYLANNQTDVLKTAEWKEFKKTNPLLANELLDASGGFINPRDYNKQSTSSFAGSSSTSASHALLSNLSSLFTQAQRRGRSPGASMMRSRSPGPSGSSGSTADSAPNSASSTASTSSNPSGSAAAAPNNSNGSAVEDRTPIRKRLRRGAGDRL
ncbi:BTB/POZ domain-containing protein [Aphelenchoides avenae]|nr:BTB/POZ domain-containing protein [Aphelenchus avenae]